MGADCDSKLPRSGGQAFDFDAIDYDNHEHVQGFKREAEVDEPLTKATTATVLEKSGPRASSHFSTAKSLLAAGGGATTATVTCDAFFAFCLAADAAHLFLVGTGPTVRAAIYL